MASSRWIDSSSKWFRDGPKPRSIITFKHPGHSSWQIQERLNEHDCQLPEEEVHNKDYEKEPPFYASILLLCQDPDANAKKAYIRIYQQVPWTKTEMDKPEFRAEQAMKTYAPVELTAYIALSKAESSNTPKLLGWKSDSQTQTGPVPNGFLVYLVWEKVPGLRLGDHTGAHTFWTFPDQEKNLIRKAVIDGLR